MAAETSPSDKCWRKPRNTWSPPLRVLLSIRLTPYALCQFVYRVNRPAVMLQRSFTLWCRISSSESPQAQASLPSFLTTRHETKVSSLNTSPIFRQTADMMYCWAMSSQAALSSLNGTRLHSHELCSRIALSCYSIWKILYWFAHLKSFLSYLGSVSQTQINPKARLNQILVCV